MGNPIVYLTLALLINLSFQQYDSGRVVKFNKNPTIVKIISFSDPNNPHIILGYPDGQICIIQASTNRTFNSLKSILTTEIKFIEINYKSRIIFVSTLTSIILINDRYTIEKKANFKNDIIGISVSEQSNGKGFLSIHMKSRIMEEQYTVFLTEKRNQDFTVLFLGNTEVYMMKYSSNHRYLYLINETRNQFTILHVQSPEKPDKNQTKNYTDKNKYPEDNVKLDPAKFQISRKFSFDIKWMIIDNKDVENINSQKMILVSDQNIVYYVEKGSIITFIPYSSHKDELVGVQFCDVNYVIIVYRHLVQGQAYFYLNLVFKDTLQTFKTIALNDIFGDISDIKQIDCNSNIISLLTSEKKLLILKGFHVFDIKPYMTIKNIQLLAFFFLFLSLFNKEKKKEMPQNQEISIEEQSQDLQKTEARKEEEGKIESTSEESNKTKKKRNK